MSGAAIHMRACGARLPALRAVGGAAPKPPEYLRQEEKQGAFHER